MGMIVARRFRTDNMRAFRKNFWKVGSQTSTLPLDEKRHLALLREQRGSSNGCFTRCERKLIDSHA
jgi:hypothetical protein